MYRIYQAVADRMEQLLLAQTTLKNNALVGTDRLIVNDTSNFGTDALQNDQPTFILMDANTTGKKIQGGFEGTEVINARDIYGDTIILKEPLKRAWNVSDSTIIKRAPNGVPVDKIILGDIEVAQKFPYISVIPISKNIEWKTLSSTNDNISIDFVVYLRDEDTQKALKKVLILTDAVEWILMSNLHIKPIGFRKAYEQTSVAMVKSIDYGTIQKGSEFLKAATLHWEASLHFWRGYLTAQGITEDLLYNYGTLRNFGPITE